MWVHRVRFSHALRAGGKIDSDLSKFPARRRKFIAGKTFYGNF
jgi:hypothetical protein